MQTPSFTARAGFGTLVSGALATGALALALLAAPAELRAEAQTYEFRANTIGNKDSIAYAGLKKFKELVEARSDGRISVKLFDSAALGDQVSGIESLQSGTLGFATVETPITTVDPLLGVTALPYVFRDRAHVRSVMEGPVGDLFERRLAAEDLRVVGFFEGGFRQITNNVRPIVTPADLEGVKMRTPDSALRVKIFNHYGANASPLPFNELYTALQTGVFDGQENPVIWVKTTNFYEVQDYLSITNHLYTVTHLLMSEEKFQALPEALQLVVQQAGADAAAHTVEVGRAAEQEIIAFLEEQGMAVNEADVAAFQAQSSELWDAWAEAQADPAFAKQLIEVIAAAGQTD